MIERVGIVQDILGRRLVLENVSSYLSFSASTLAEWEFLRAGRRSRPTASSCSTSTTLYVSGVNHESDPLVYLDAIPAKRVQQIHLAGHDDHGAYLIDTHDRAVAAPVWDLYVAAISQFRRGMHLHRARCGDTAARGAPHRGGRRPVRCLRRTLSRAA